MNDTQKRRWRWKDPVLDKIVAWCDEHGWDALDGEEFNEWLKAEGIDRSTLMIGKCGLPPGL